MSVGLISIAALDARGIGTLGPGGRRRVSWAELEAEPPGAGRTFRTFTGRADPTFRRLDRPTRAVVLTAEAVEPRALLTPQERESTAVVVESVTGCLEADLRYTRSLCDGIVQAAIFPYTLQSTCLGDVALRHGLRGPTLSLSVERAERGEALREARRLLAAGQARFVLVGSVDVLGEAQEGVETELRCVLGVLGSAEAGGVVGLPGGEDPFAGLADEVLG